MAKHSEQELSLWLSDSYGTGNEGLSLGEVLSNAAQMWPDREAVVYTHQPAISDTRWTYRQLNSMAGRLASSLLERGYQRGDAVAVWGPNHPEWILLEYGLAKAGLTLVALNPLYKSSELKYALNASDVKAIFHADKVGETDLAETISAIRHEVPLLQGVYSFSRDLDTFLSTSGDIAVDKGEVSPDDVLMIQYTSGTTGKPKAAQLTHAAITRTAKLSYQRWGFDEGSRVCHGFPLFHVGGSGNSIPGAALNGVTTLPLYIFKADQTLDILEKEQCSGFIGVPTMVTAMLDHPSFRERDFSSMKRIVLGGAQVPAYLINRCEELFGVEVLNCYGQTETCGVTTSTVGSDSVEIKSSTSGRPLDGVSVKITDKQGDIVPRGVTGELCYQGAGRMSGYRDKQANQAVFDPEGWLRSGDLARMDGMGNITVVGRSREMIIRGGENLSPSEIEAYMLEHPQIADVAVIGLPDKKYGEEACAVVILTGDATADADEIRDWCREQVSRWKVPRYVAFVDEFPTTHSGKVKKFELQKLMLRRFSIE